jgi:hypothetical protein
MRPYFVFINSKRSNLLSVLYFCRLGSMKTRAGSATLGWLGFLCRLHFRHFLWFRPILETHRTSKYFRKCLSAITIRTKNPSFGKTWTSRATLFRFWNISTCHKALVYSQSKWRLPLTYFKCKDYSTYLYNRIWSRKGCYQFIAVYSYYSIRYRKIHTVFRYTLFKMTFYSALHNHRISSLLWEPKRLANKYISLFQMPGPSLVDHSGRNCRVLLRLWPSQRWINIFIE